MENSSIDKDSLIGIALFNTIFLNFLFYSCGKTRPIIRKHAAEPRGKQPMANIDESLPTVDIGMEVSLFLPIEIMKKLSH